MLTFNSFFKMSTQVFKSKEILKQKKHFFKTMSNGHNHNNGSSYHSNNGTDNLNLMIEKG